MSQQRWDVVISVLEGPMAGMGQQVLRGPVVRIGAAPGPGGFKLNGYRGLADRHATISAYEGGTATIAPLGTNQVRMAPHSNVSWKDIDPMSAPEFLSQGCAIHLGPVGRGCTIEFVKCQQLGVWTGGALSSEAASVTTTGGVGAPPAAFDARATSNISSSSVPPWFIGCLLMMTAVFVTVPLAAVLITVIDIERLGPTEEGESFYDFATIEAKDINPKLKDGMKQPFADFVMSINADLGRKPVAADPDKWDEVFYEKVTASVQTHLKSWSVFKRLDVIHEDYATVLEIMRDDGLPDVFAAIPYLESRYQADMQSIACAKGYFQFMPEVAYRIDQEASFGFKVKNCSFKDADILWSPDRKTPVSGVMKNAPYVHKQTQTCRIKSCQQDDRMDLKKSAMAAAFSLKDAYDDPDLKDSGSVVQIAILSHNAGWDDAVYGSRPKAFNLRPAFLMWAKKHDEGEWHKFYGENITTSSFDHGGGGDRKGSALPPETQHYAYTIIAEHLLAVCYYGQNYADQHKVFADYKQYTKGGGYCNDLKIPTSDEVKAYKGKK